MYNKTFRNMSDDAIFSIISKDFDSSDEYSRWENIPEPTETETIEESFTGKTDAELFAELSSDFESSDGQTRYKDCKKPATKKITKTINKSNKDNTMNTMTKVTLASGKTVLCEAKHAIRLQKSIAELSEDTKARVLRAVKRLERKDTFVASIKHNGPSNRTNQFAGWINTAHSAEKAKILANDKDRIVYSI